MKRLVVDASVVLKWYLPDEAYGENALSLLHRYIADDVGLIGPSLLEYEVVNGLVIARRRGRIEEGKILAAIEGFLDLGIPFVDLSTLYGTVVHYCNVYHCSTYGASYLALAEREGVMLITADERLFNAVKKDLAWVKWLGDSDGSAVS